MVYTSKSPRERAFGCIQPSAVCLFLMKPDNGLDIELTLTYIMVMFNKEPTGANTGKEAFKMEKARPLKGF